MIEFVAELILLLIIIFFIFFFVFKKSKAIKKVTQSFSKEKQLAWDEYVKFRDLWLLATEKKNSPSIIEFYYRCANKALKDFELFGIDDKDQNKKP